MVTYRGKNYSVFYGTRNSITALTTTAVILSQLSPTPACVIRALSFYVFRSKYLCISL